MLNKLRSSTGARRSTSSPTLCRRNLSVLPREEAMELYQKKDPQEHDGKYTHRPSDPIPMRRITSCIVEPNERPRSPLIPAGSPHDGSSAQSPPEATPGRPRRNSICSLSPPSPPSMMAMPVAGTATLKIRELDHNTADALAYALGDTNLSPRMQRPRTVRKATTMQLMQEVHILRDEQQSECM